MNTEVLFENKNNKLVITLNKDVSYSEIKAKMQKILEASDTLFDKIKPPIIVTGKRLLDGEETEIAAMIATKTDLEVKIERPKQMGLATINNIFTKDTSVTQTKVIKGMLRSGTRVDFEGSIVVLGDVNSGAEIIAEGNVIVLGKLFLALCVSASVDFKLTRPLVMLFQGFLQIVHGLFILFLVL